MSAALRLYGAAGWVARPALRRLLRRRVGAAKELPERLGERYGAATLPRPPGRLLWLHAASVGETMSVLPVIGALVADAEVLLTTGTATSAALAAARLPAGARHQFVPLDVAPWVARFLDHWRPDAAAFVESEIWPAMLAGLDARHIPRLLINARLSRRSARRWSRLPGLARRLLGGFRHIHAQSAEDAASLRSLGIGPALLWGNLKFAAPALPADPAALAAWRGMLPGPVWLAASTHPGEETPVLQAHRQLAARHPGLVTVIAPRHPARGAEIAALASGLASGLAGGLAVARRAAGEQPRPGGVYIADTLGDLGLFYRLAAFAFIGGSLVRHGGQNVIEPARLGCPVLVGPHTENFIAATACLAAAGGLRRVAAPAELAAAALDWLDHPAAARRAGAAAAAAFEDCAELPERLARLILASAA